MHFDYYWYKLLDKVTGNREWIPIYLRKRGAIIGKNNLICCDIATTESKLIEIKNNVVISSEVEFVTHDHSIMKVIPDKSNLFGKIIIGNNCFVGTRCTIMYGVELADNIIVAAGSVVTKSFKESNIIIGGNPAKKISDWDTFRKKGLPYAANKSILKDDNQLQSHLVRR